MRETGPMRRLRLVAVSWGAGLLLLLSVHTAGATADPLWNRQYGPTQIGAPTAWQKTTAKGQKVAVVDNGVDVDHPDLKPNLDLANSYDFVCDDTNPDDDSRDPGHGTHVAGTIAAVTNNNIGVAGVAPDAKIMGLKISYGDDPCDAGQPTSLLQITRAVGWAVDHGAKAINLSLSQLFDLPGITNTVGTACEDAFRRGSLCFVAAGNSGETRSSGYEFDFNAVVVTANDSTGKHAGFGQKADTKWSVSAPGVDILSTWPIDDKKHNGYNSSQGTSMAAPHATGAGALLFGAGMNNRQVAETLVNTAGPARESAVEGAGLIRVDRALGLETTSTSIGQRPGSGTGVVTKGGRQAAGGGSAAIAPTTTSTQPARQVGAAFEEGLTTGDQSRDFDAIRLQEASKNSANKPFNATAPLVGISVLAGIAMAALAIPRIRSKDDVPLA